MSSNTKILETFLYRVQVITKYSPSEHPFHLYHPVLSPFSIMLLPSRSCVHNSQRLPLVRGTTRDTGHTAPRLVAELTRASPLTIYSSAGYGFVFNGYHILHLFLKTDNHRVLWSFPDHLACNYFVYFNKFISQVMITKSPLVAQSVFFIFFFICLHFLFPLYACLLLIQ